MLDFLNSNSLYLLLRFLLQRFKKILSTLPFDIKYPITHNIWDHLGEYSC